MSSTVSYANIAAQGTNLAVVKNVDTSNESFATENLNSSDTPAPAETQPSSVSDASEGTIQAIGQNQEAEDVPEEKDSQPKVSQEKREKKSLAPAPVPERSVWLANGSNTGDSSSVDEHKWPTPDKINQLDNATSSKSQQQKFLKPITNKWVPIKAKVVLPNARASGQKQNRSKKNKKHNPNGNASSVGSSAPANQNQQNNSKKLNSYTKLNGQVKPQSAPFSPQQGDKKEITTVTNNSARGFQNFSVEDGEDQPTGAEQQQYTQFQPPSQTLADQPFGIQPGQQVPENFKPRFQPNGNTFNQKNNYRRYNSYSSSPQHYKQRYNNSQLSPQNGFYHPQPYVQGPEFQNFNNRQFRPQGSFRQQGYVNGYAGAYGYPSLEAQIPPPISPKQDPQQALTQQIDYYFSLENLIRDVFLRKNMDDVNGWVSLPLILNFKRVKIIINGIQNSAEDKSIDANSVVLESIKNCENLEINYTNGKSAENASIQDVELRVKDNFKQWVLQKDA